MRPGWGSAVVAVVAIAVCAAAAAPATAATPSWSGKYSLVRYAVNKTGTSVAASQAEPTFSAEYVFSTVCSAASCVATANNGPTPKNPTISVPSHYTWDGARWVERFDFQWDCYLGEGVPKVWAPAKSWAFYTPQSDGSLRGTWHTDILSGPCKGDVEMPVAAVRVGS
jgi:opacity protein-like surface antigen